MPDDKKKPHGWRWRGWNINPGSLERAKRSGYTPPAEKQEKP